MEKGVRTSNGDIQNNSNISKGRKIWPVLPMRDSANSVIANIAEAHGRYYFADKTRVLYTSRGECEEERSHLRVASGLKYIDKKVFTRLDKEYEGLS